MNLNSTRLNYNEETTCTKFRGGKFSKGSPKIFKTSCLFHCILCILDFLEKDRILYLMKIDDVNFVEKFTENKKFQNCCNEFLKKKEKE